MKVILVIICVSFCFFADAQVTQNIFLKKKLDSIYVLDQKYREAQAALSNGGKADSIASSFGRSSEGLFMFLVNEMQRVDSLNMVEVKAIINRYGYPGKSLVGTPTNEAAWNVIQHSPNIKDHIKLIESAAKQHEIPFVLYCKMLDRLLMEEGKEQVYGTQIYGLNVVNRITGKNEWHMFVWPIQNAADINSTRKKAGFELSMEGYAKTFNITYQPMTLLDVQRLKKQ